MKHVAWFVLPALAALGAACSGTKIITVKQTNLDGNSEYFVCETGEVKTCHGERAGDIDPPGYQSRAEVHAPPPGCAHGVANLDIVLEGSDVKRVRYECAQKPLEGDPGAGGAPTTPGLPSSVPPPGLPSSVPTLPPSTPGPGTGLPPSVPASGGSSGGAR